MPRKRRRLRGLFHALAALVALVLIAAPFAVPPVVERIVTGKLAEFGVRAKVAMTLGYCWRNGPGVKGALRVSVPDTPWNVRAAFGASCSEWSAKVSMRETAFSEQDPLVRALLERYPVQGVSNLVFRGSVALDATAERTFHTPVPAWTVKVPLRKLNASLMSGDQPVEVTDFSVTAGASGIADHVDVRAMYPRAKSLTVGKFAVSNFHATVRSAEKVLIVNEAGASFCGGKVHVYSVYLDPGNLNSGFSLFLDNVEAGEVLNHISGFRGTASGRLHGKLRAHVKEGGRAIYVRDAFLYSTPGETGKFHLNDPTVVTENLAYAGMDEAYRANVADALTDLDYKVLRIDLAKTGDKTARLSFRIGGSATRGTRTVPVDLTLNVNGELEQLINAGLGYSAKMKGKK